MKGISNSFLRTICALIIGLVLVMFPNEAGDYFVITIGVVFLIPALLSIIGYFAMSAEERRLTEERPRKGTPSGAFSPAFLNHTAERSSPSAGKESDSRGGRWEVQLRAGGR